MLSGASLWQHFHEKYQSITGNFQALRAQHQTTSTASTPLAPQNLEQYSNAATTIARWWKRLRSSGQRVTFNPNGNHPDAFHALLNGKSVRKSFMHHYDAALLQALLQGNWSHPYFAEALTHVSALNLFASGKIDWQQKATISDLLETATEFGSFTAHPILTEQGEFTPQAQEHLFGFLETDFVPRKITADEVNQFKVLVQALPKSEQYFFVFAQQQMTEQGSHPSVHNGMREITSKVSNVLSSGTRFMNAQHLSAKENQDYRAQLSALKVEGRSALTTPTHPLRLSYKGILKLSYGAENALGIALYGLHNWHALIPGIGERTIDDVDLYASHKARPTISGESRYLGFYQSRQLNVHNDTVSYPDLVAHDHYHRTTAAFLGCNVHNAIEHIIQLARHTFGYRWSKDLWILRDFELAYNVVIERNRIKKSPDPSTARFAQAISMPYLKVQLEGCSAALKEKLTTILFDENQHPRQITLCWIIDLVRRAEYWKATFGIQDNEAVFVGPYPRILVLAKSLHAAGLFTDNMKANILKLDRFIKKQPQAINDAILAVFANIDSQLDNYRSKRDNKQVFLGFRDDHAALRTQQQSTRQNRPFNSPKPKRQQSQIMVEHSGAANKVRRTLSFTK